MRVVLGLIFALVGFEKLTGTGNTVDYFAAIGFGQWFRYATGSFDIIGAVLLFVPGRTWAGAAVLACNVGLAALISLTVLRGNETWGAPVMVIVPLVLTALTAGLGWLTRPQPLR